MEYCPPDGMTLRLTFVATTPPWDHDSTGEGDLISVIPEAKQATLALPPTDRCGTTLHTTATSHPHQLLTCTHVGMPTAVGWAFCCSGTLYRPTSMEQPDASANSPAAVSDGGE